MDLLIAANSVAAANRDVAPVSGTPQWATDGNPAAGISATEFPAYHYNMVMAELCNLVQKAGLTLSGSDWTQLEQAITQLCGSGRYLTTHIIASSQTYAPSSSAKMLAVRMVGAGGAGGGSYGNVGTNCSVGGAGAAGGYARFLIDLSKISGPFALTIGSGGTGVQGGSGGAGGTTSFGSLVTCQGGSPGSSIGYIAAGAGAWGGQSQGGAVTYESITGLTMVERYLGENGQSPFVAPSFNSSGAAEVGVPIPPIGAASPFGAGGANGTTTGSESVTGEDAGSRGGFGAGGGGTGSTGTGTMAGGNGAGGVIEIVEWS